MTDALRVPMPARHPIFRPGDVAASSTPTPSCGRRFTLDVAEEALERMAPAAIEFVTQRLAESVVGRQRADMERVVSSYLRDRAWAEPIIREAIREEVHRVVRGIFETHSAAFRATP